jgi:low affinity Fe/Cu permease
MVRPTLTKLGVLTAHPAAFLVVGAYVALWLAFSASTFDWHGAATVATWLMTLFIQRAEHRDTQAIHAKLDELLRAEGKPGTNLPAWMMKNRRKSRRIAFSTRSRQAERPARPAA